METKVITCRTHGGTFRVPVKRGRPPVNCTPENKCRKTPQGAPIPAARVTSNPRARVVDAPVKHSSRVAPDEKRIRDAEAVSAAKARALSAEYEPVRQDKPVEAAPKPRTAEPRWLTKAKQTKAQLEALGWQAEGSANASNLLATVTATRGTELLVITWDTASGELLSQDYSLWDTSVGTGRNGKPDSKLPFDPDEVPDRSLVEFLRGTKVTWWNSLAQANETAVVSPDKITIEHSYNGLDDEVPGDRIVKFADHEGKGFRAFRLAALIKVG